MGENMPAKLERCVREVMKQGKTEEQAWAICNAAMDGIITDSVIIKATIDSISGFLTAPVTLSRIGVQEYYGFELGLKDRAMERIGVFRSPEEVFHPDSIQSFTNLVITRHHPTEPVTTKNVKDLQVGSVSGITPNKEKGVLDGIATVTDEDNINLAKDKKELEVSVGYSNELVDKKGVYDGKPYEFEQTKIRANHLAIVDAGRCGPECKITVDHKQKEKMHMIRITIDGIVYETDNEQLAQAVQKQQKAWDAEKEKMEEKMKEDEEEMEKLKAEKEKAEAAKDAAIASKLSDPDLESLIKDRAKLISTAEKILGDELPECNNCPVEIKSAVVSKIFPDMKLDGKSNDYITAAYDMAVERFENSGKTFDQFRKDFQQDNKTSITRDSARGGYMKRIGMEVA